MEERLQKILSAHGVSSRRAAEGYLSAGRAASAAARPPYLSDAQQAQGLRNHPL